MSTSSEAYAEGATAESFFGQLPLLPALAFAWGAASDGTLSHAAVETDQERKLREDTDKARAKMLQLDCRLADTLRRARVVRQEGLELSDLALTLHQARPPSAALLQVIKGGDDGSDEDVDDQGWSMTPSALHSMLHSRRSSALAVKQAMLGNKESKGEGKHVERNNVQRNKLAAASAGGMTPEEESYVQALLGQGQEGGMGLDDARLPDPPPVSVVAGEGYLLEPHDALRLAHIDARLKKLNGDHEDLDHDDEDLDHQDPDARAHAKPSSSQLLNPSAASESARVEGKPASNHLAVVREERQQVAALAPTWFPSWIRLPWALVLPCPAPLAASCLHPACILAWRHTSSSCNTARFSLFLSPSSLFLAPPPAPRPLCIEGEASRNKQTHGPTLHGRSALTNRNPIPDPGVWQRVRLECAASSLSASDSFSPEFLNAASESSQQVPRSHQHPLLHQHQYYYYYYYASDNIWRMLRLRKSVCCPSPAQELLLKTLRPILPSAGTPPVLSCTPPPCLIHVSHSRVSPQAPPCVSPRPMHAPTTCLGAWHTHACMHTLDFDGAHP